MRHRRRVRRTVFAISCIVFFPIATKSDLIWRNKFCSVLQWKLQTFGRRRRREKKSDTKKARNPYTGVWEDLWRLKSMLRSFNTTIQFLFIFLLLFLLLVLPRICKRPKEDEDELKRHGKEKSRRIIRRCRSDSRNKKEPCKGQNQQTDHVLPRFHHFQIYVDLMKKRERPWLKKQKKKNLIRD